MNEAEIIQEVLDGNPDKYTALVERYFKGLIIHCERIVGDRDDAEDIAQEAFIKAYEQLNSFDAKRARFSTWVYKIATNKAIDHLRKNKRKLNVEDVELLAESTMPLFLEEEEREAVRQAVLELVPPEYRHIIAAYYWQGKSYQQIAKEMDKPVNTIGTWMRRAKLQLKEKLV
ncbi:MAG TPA: RNA polymerase sigma factor [Candidatus Limnocylindria bacterium]|nr:RNA polymerase sigma factor [Candidatus Limnocylindria bacterium]